MNTFDDPALFFDMPGLLFDSESVPQQSSKRMKNITLGLHSRDDEQTIQLTENIITGMTGNPNFGTPNPPLNTLEVVKEELLTLVNEVGAAREALSYKISQRKAKLQQLRTLLTQEAEYVENTSAGDLLKIQSASMPLRAPAISRGLPAKVLSLETFPGENDGQLLARWEPVEGALNYEVQTTGDANNAASWVQRAIVSPARAAIDGLPSGGRCWIRVRAFGTKGPGPFSDPAVKTVP